MEDLRLLLVQDRIPIQHLDFLIEDGTPLLDARGRDFRYVESVKLNGIEVPEYILVSRTRVLVPIPRDRWGANITSLDILSSRFTATELSHLQPKISSTNKGVKGLERLVQRFVRTLHTTPGSNPHDPEDGGGLLGILGMTYAKNSPGSLRGAFIAAVDRTSSQILKRQSESGTNIPASERLASAEVLNVEVSAEGEVFGRVRLVSAAGESTEAGVLPSTEG